MTPKQVFETGLQYHHYANTAYPLTPKSFKEFRINAPAEYPDFLKKQWADVDHLNLYVHVPFCTVRCRFCEYVVLENTGINTENVYVTLLLKEIEMYKQLLQGKTIEGYDLGGGTPTKLSAENLQKITTAVQTAFDFNNDVIYSIETTPAIAANEPEKLKAVFDMGYKRISMGVQTISEKLLNELGREGTTHIYEKAVENIRKTGYTKFNIDLMYGFLHQTEESFETTLRYAMALKPEYITLYRNRYKGTKLENEAGGVSLYKIILQYRLAYRVLTENGYMANVGKNTFSRIEGDYGTSDYLTNRVIEGSAYLGMGLGAQSFAANYLAYNEGAANKKLTKYKQKIENNQFPIQDIYALNQEEAIAKMISVAFYFGFIDFEAFKKRFGVEFTTHFRNEVAYVLENNLMEKKGKRIYFTPRGADYLNGIIPLFYSQRSKKELLDLYHSQNQQPKSQGEKEFLKAYNIQKFERPSVATDIVVFALPSLKNCKKFIEHNDFQILLVKRGEHPYMNEWALPGGFVKPNEPVEQTAHRELKEETGVTAATPSQLQMFSTPGRDPRGWIISCAFTAIVDKNALSLQFGSDAIDTQLYAVNLAKESHENSLSIANARVDTYHLQLTHENSILSATIEKQTTVSATGIHENYEITQSNGLAFDHAKIILIALEKMK